MSDTEIKQEVDKDSVLPPMNTPQLLFIGYTLAILVDLTVLNFFDEYWEYVSIGSFTISLLAAMLLQLLLKLTIKLEHKVADHYKKQSGKKAKIKRGVITYLILVGSKIVMLEAINIMFGDQIVFTGPWNGLVAFVVVLLAIIIAEFVVSKIYRYLGSK